jgi:hypothetical protein
VITKQGDLRKDYEVQDVIKNRTARYRNPVMLWSHVMILSNSTNLASKNLYKYCKLLIIFVVKIVEVVSGIIKPVIISGVEDKDFKLLIKKRFSFVWKAFRNSAIIYKLQIEGDDDILGVMGLIDYPEEKRIEIKLLASSIENVGKQKRYEGIAGCLIAFACQLAATKYGQDACVSLLPKTKLIKHYMQKYQMQHGGCRLYLEGNSLNKLLKEFL